MFGAIASTQRARATAAMTRRHGRAGRCGIAWRAKDQRQASYAGLVPPASKLGCLWRDDGEGRGAPVRECRRSS